MTKLFVIHPHDQDTLFVHSKQAASIQRKLRISHHHLAAIQRALPAGVVPTSMGAY